MIKTKAYQFRGIETFSKTVLSFILIKEGANIMEVHPEQGNNLGKWQRAKIKSLVCLESDQELLNEVEKKWAERKKPFQAQFISSSPLGTIHMNQNVQNIFCFSGIDQYFTTKDFAEEMFQNLYKCMDKGGYFCGLFMDSETLFHRIQELEGNEDKQAIITGGKLYNLTLPTEFEHFGTKVKLEIAEEESPIYQYLIHTPSFIKLAKKAGFEVVSMSNLHHFYDDYKELYQDLLVQLQVYKKDMKIEQNQLELVDMFMIFILKKL